MKLRAQYLCKLHVTPSCRHSQLPVTNQAQTQNYHALTSLHLSSSKSLNPPEQVQNNMEPDPNANRITYTAGALFCEHFVHYSIPCAPSMHPGGPAEDYGEISDWADEEPPPNFVGVSANTLLCEDCEKEMRGELRDATGAYSLIWSKTHNKTEPPNEARLIATDRYVKASINVANFEACMAERQNTLSQIEAKQAREQKWEAAKKVKFAVEEGEGAGEKPRKQMSKMPTIALGWIEVDDDEAEPPLPSTQEGKDEEESYVFADHNDDQS